MPAHRDHELRCPRCRKRLRVTIAATAAELHCPGCRRPLRVTVTAPAADLHDRIAESIEALDSDQIAAAAHALGCPDQAPLAGSR
ncbi:MAG: hypothetical protein OXB99_04820 [Acidimicrobiaceae bacterium]|nr:hypothetical protein [Acidimicrobiaceae bacterium]